jgi:hypothetical protein
MERIPWRGLWNLGSIDFAQNVKQDRKYTLFCEISPVTHSFLLLTHNVQKSEWSRSRGYHDISALTVATTGVSHIRKLRGVISKLLHPVCFLFKNEFILQNTRDIEMKFLSAIKIQKTARLSCKLTIMILMVWRVADRWRYDAGMQHDGEVVV